LNELLERLKAALSDRYDVERELGEGGMATVFLARDIRHERKVAIKVLHEDLGAAVGAERFRREIAIATSLTHPHILTLYDSGEAAGLLYYVMPFIEGESLRHRIDREKQLPIDQALKVTAEVASALGYAHRKGIVHRDIKPENILLEDGHAIVADFGIARAVQADGGGALTKTGMSLGTPTYMSPEQAFAEKDIDGRSDMYSLACVLFEMLTGEPPFTGPNAQAIMARHSLSEVPSMQIVRATIPDEVEDVVQKALSKAPADRFATVDEFAEELQECVIDYATTTRRAMTQTRAMRGTTTRRTPALPPPAPWYKKKLAVGGIAAAVIVAAAGGWFALGGRTATLSAASAAAAGLDLKKVAVLYFQDISPKGELGYIADGLTENLISRLQEVQALNVVSSNGVAPFRESNAAADSIARALGAATIVRGTIEPQGDKLKIRVRLIDGASGDQKFDESFEQASANIVQAQDSVATRVAEMLRNYIGSQVALKEARSGTTNAEAWTLYQRAQRTRKDADAMLANADSANAAKLFALADSLLAAAGGLDRSWIDPIVAQSSISLARARAALTPSAAEPLIDKGIAQAEQALAKKARDAGALEMRGTLRYSKWAYGFADNPAERTALLNGAEQDLSQSVSIDPARASAHAMLSTVYSQLDDTNKAKIEAQRAYEQDAYLSNTDEVLWKLYATSYDLEQWRDAEKYCADGGQRFPDNPRFVRCRLWLLTVKSVTPNPDQAWADYARLEKVTPPRSWRVRQYEARMLVAAGLARAGLKDSARAVMRRSRIDPADDKEGELAGIEAFIWTLIGAPADTAEAFNVLGRYVSGSPQHRALLAESQSWWWRGLKQDRRFNDLVGRDQ
jgi:eukaryotic-like serine/threonine-protein kinase